jgi:hypothetical protein
LEVGRRRASWTALAAASAFALVGATASTAYPAATHVSAARAPVANVFFDITRLGEPVPIRFPGLSFEVSALPAIAHDATVGNLVALLRSIGRGVLRFGGASVDSGTAFSGNGRRSARRGTTIITPADFERLRTLLTRTGWRAVLALPLARFDPRGAAREAAAASRRLGSNLAAFEIGNEPNAYWLGRVRPPSWGYAEYRSAIASYRSAIAAAAPGVPIAGPDTVMSDSVGPLAGFDGFAWLGAYAGDEHAAILTPHLYALDGCFGAPTIEQLLGPTVVSAQNRIFRRIASIGRAHGTPVRLGETNNVSCGGRAGVSDTFGAGLWAVRYVLAAARVGIAGVNFHTLPDSCTGYSPICAPRPADLAIGRLRAMPEWYALRLMRYLVGERPLRSSASGDVAGLTVDALASLHGVDAVLVNANPATTPPIAVRLHTPGRLALGSVLRLTAPALESSAGIRLVRDPAASPGRSPRRRRFVRVDGGIGVTVPGATAVLVRLQADSPNRSG